MQLNDYDRGRAVTLLRQGFDAGNWQASGFLIVSDLLTQILDALDAEDGA